MTESSREDAPFVVHLASGREWRGGQKQTWLLAREIHARGVNQRVVTRRGSELANRLASDGIHVESVPWRGALSLRALIAGRQVIRSRAGILHAHDPHAVTMAGVIAATTGAPFVATRRVALPLRRAGFWSRADKLVAISGSVRASLLASGIAPSRIETIASGIDVEAVRATRAASAVDDLGIPAGAPLVMSVGALDPLKGQRTIIDAAQHLQQRMPALVWVIAGAGRLRGQLEQEIANSGLRATVRLVGHLENPIPLMAAADCFVSASLSEGLGTATLDAMALSLPIVATSAPGTTDVLAPDAGLLVPVGDATALADAVQAVLTTPELALSLAARARERSQRFSAARMALEYLALYRSLMHRPLLS